QHYYTVYLFLSANSQVASNFPFDSLDTTNVYTLSLHDALPIFTPARAATPRLAFVQRGGRLHALPAASVLGIPTRVGPFVRTRLFSWPGKLRMGAELFVPRRREAGDESIGAFMRRRFGREATDYLAEPLLAGI